MSIRDVIFDWAEFTRLSRMGRDAFADGRFRQASKQLSEALSLYKGGALTGTTEFLQSEAATGLEEARMVALEGRIEAHIALGRYADLVPELLNVVTSYPFRERVRAQLMFVLHRCGRQSDAIGVYHEGRQMLAEELGVDPGPMMSEVYQGILTGQPLLRCAA
ncbi:AfsR/SARP family transcriptional regulator [Streptomyces sp. NPDC023588]|uniref:AfsR/SARP family transcriptional regulator n=1 Tax=Streptomyces sp. NPDC023588 TaxID=3154907 RepID=UPI0033CEA9F2